jgi:hypothetical protein
MVRASAKEILASVHRHHDRRHDKADRYRRDTRRPNILSREFADAKDLDGLAQDGVHRWLVQRRYATLVTRLTPNGSANTGS